jgi:thymidylate synthase ThyX
MSISAKIIADSISPEGIRMISFEITCHRWILAEINTHRALSRNYRSSRAVPVTKLIEEVRYNPAMPVAWLKNKPGMVATEPMTADEASLARSIWKSAAFDAAYRAGTLSDLGLHKQWVNRILEPYLYVHGVISGTDWANFYSLRRAPDAQPEFKALARCHVGSSGRE